MGGTFSLERDRKAATQSQPISYFHNLSPLFSVSLPLRGLSFSLIYTHKTKEREVPGLVLESILSTSRGTEAILSEVKPIVKIS